MRTPCCQENARMAQGHKSKLRLLFCRFLTVRQTLEGTYTIYNRVFLAKYHKFYENHVSLAIVREQKNYYLRPCCIPKYFIICLTATLMHLKYLDPGFVVL